LSWLRGGGGGRGSSGPLFISFIAGLGSQRLGEEKSESQIWLCYTLLRQWWNMWPYWYGQNCSSQIEVGFMSFLMPVWGHSNACLRSYAWCTQLMKHLFYWWLVDLGVWNQLIFKKFQSTYWNRNHASIFWG
jgi:hypothetical protein